MRVLLIEDDKLLGSGIASGLRHNDFQVEWFQTGRDVAAALKVEHFDILVLDLGLPDCDGMEVLRALRSDGQSIPVLVLTARDAVEDRIIGLDGGADDYLVKPFDLDELCARLRALCRRHNGRATNLLKVGDLRIDTRSRTACIGDSRLNLTRREFSLLQALSENTGRTFTLRQLEDHLYSWGQEVESNTVQVHVHNLRKKIGKEYISTVRGIGYMMPDVRAIE